MIFKVVNSNKSFPRKFFKNPIQPRYTSSQSAFIIPEPILIDKKNVTTLSQVFVSRLPNKAAARFRPRSQATQIAVIGPTAGIIPKNTPTPTPKAILCGVSLMRKSLR